MYGTRAGHPSVQHFSLHHPEQGRRGLSFTVEGAAASRPSRHPISGMSSLARHSASSIALFSQMGAGVSLWVLRTIRSGYTLQFGKNPPCFDGVHLTVVNSASKASVLRQELSSLLQKGAIEEVPQSDVERGFFSRYLLVLKRDGGLRPILDLRRLNFSLYKGKFKMLTMKTIMSQVQGGDWFVTIDLKDVYFHIQVVQRHRRFLRFSWHINCLELRAVFLALINFLPVLGGYHIIVRTDNMAVVSHINHQGGSRSRNLDRLACRLLLWSQDKFLSLRAVHVP